MLLSENFKIALRALRANKMRSVLTMLGIVIGVATVVALLSIGKEPPPASPARFKAVALIY